MDIDTLEKDFLDLKDYVYKKIGKLETEIDSTNKTINELKISFAKFETLMTEKFNNLEKILSTKDRTWLTVLGSIISPIIVGVFLFFILK